MVATIDRLLQEHRDIETLLEILETELAAFDEARKPDYEVMAAIADYFLGYPAACHHPKEDLVYAALVARRPDCAASVGDVIREHDQLGKIVGLFEEAVTNVMHDAEVPREAFDHVVRHFVDAQRAHIAKEEAGLFVEATKVLGDADWQAIEGRLANRDDPLFGTMPEERFADLRRDIAEWESERSRIR